MRKLLLTLLVLFLVPALHATTYGHVKYGWTESNTSTATIAGYNVYETTVACTTSFSVTGQTPLNGSAVIATTSYTTTFPTSSGCIYVTAVSTMGVESSPSPGFSIDLSAPSSPSGVTATPIP